MSSGVMQGGNNNTYCHDSELNWFDWDQANQDVTGYARFFRCLVNLRSEQLSAVAAWAPSRAQHIGMLLVKTASLHHDSFPAAAVLHHLEFALPLTLRIPEVTCSMGISDDLSLYQL